MRLLSTVEVAAVAGDRANPGVGLYHNVKRNDVSGAVRTRRIKRDAGYDVTQRVSWRRPETPITRRNLLLKRVASTIKRMTQLIMFVMMTTIILVIITVLLLPLLLLIIVNHYYHRRRH